MSSIQPPPDPVWEAILNPPRPIEGHPNFARFQQAIGSASQEEMANFAAQVRARHCNQEHADVPSVMSPPRIAKAPFLGTKNLVYAVGFADGVRWCFKVPGTWHPLEWAVFNAAALDAEVATMMFVRENTTIPVPRVYASSNGKDEPSPISVPFILTEWIEAYLLETSWHEGALICEGEELRLQKERTVISLASYMNQLSRCSFEKGGWLGPGPHGTPPGVGGFYLDNEEYHIYPWLPRARFEQPCETYRAFFLRHLIAWPIGSNRSEKNDYRFAHFLCSRIPNQTACDQKDFVLAYPNLDLANILIHGDGNVAALHDWSGAAVVPRVIGYESYPRWLTLDWFYEVQPRPGDLHMPDPPDVRIDMRESWHSMVQGRNYVRSDWGVRQDATRQSLFFGRLWEAIRHPQHRHLIMLVLFQRIVQAATNMTPDWRDYDERIEALDSAEDENTTRQVFELGLENLLNHHIWLI